MLDNYAGWNETIVTLFRNILNIEEKFIARGEFSDLTCKEVHVIEAVGLEGGLNMSSIARKLNVTMGTLTASINTLVRKGYVNRARSEKDKRIVCVNLLEKGKKVFWQHKQFHDRMLQTLLGGLNSQEAEMLFGALKRLDGMLFGGEG